MSASPQATQGDAAQRIRHSRQTRRRLPLPAPPALTCLCRRVSMQRVFGEQDAAATASASAGRARNSSGDLWDSQGWEQSSRQSAKEDDASWGDGSMLLPSSSPDLRKVGRRRILEDESGLSGDAADGTGSGLVPALELRTPQKVSPGSYPLPSACLSAATLMPCAPAHGLLPISPAQQLTLPTPLAPHAVAPRHE